jgi:hypothetical protein
MKKPAVLAALLFIAVSLAAPCHAGNPATFAPTLGTLHIPRVNVGGSAFVADLLLQDGCFVVTAIAAWEPAGDVNDDIFGGGTTVSLEDSASEYDATFDPNTLTLYIPKVTIFPFAYEIWMVFQESCFVITDFNEVSFLPEEYACIFQIGDPDYCFSCGPCTEGQGMCNRNYQCIEGLVCDLTTNTCVRPE